jgi:hypothetical protein
VFTGAHRRPVRLEICPAETWSGMRGFEVYLSKANVIIAPRHATCASALSGQELSCPLYRHGRFGGQVKRQTSSRLFDSDLLICIHIRDCDSSL